MLKLKEKLLCLISNQNWKELANFILESNEETFLNALRQVIYQKDGSTIIDGILKSLPCDQEKNTALKLKVFEEVLTEIRRSEATAEREDGRLLSLLLVHVTPLPTASLKHLVQWFLNQLCSGASFGGRWTDVFGSAMRLCAHRPDVDNDGEDPWRSRVVSEACGCDWQPHVSATLLPIFKDMNLPKEDLLRVLWKCERGLREASPSAAANVARQMLLFCPRELSGVALDLLRRVFDAEPQAEKEGGEDGISEAFDEDRSSTIYNSASASEVETAATVLAVVTQQAQFDSDILNFSLKNIRCTWVDDSVLSPFNLALALAIASLDRYKEQMVSALKQCLMRRLRQDLLRQRSCWLRNFGAKATGDKKEADTTVGSAFAAVVRRYSVASQQVSEGAMSVCFALLECPAGPRGTSFESLSAVATASLVLPPLLKEDVRLAVASLRRLASLAITSPNPRPYIDLIGRLVRMNPLMVMEQTAVVRDLIEQLAFVGAGGGGADGAASSALMAAVVPLIKVDAAFRDAAVIALRKMLFAKQAETRVIAVRCILLVAGACRLSGRLPSSQASSSFSSTLSQVTTAQVHNAGAAFRDPRAHDALCAEVLGILRRSLTHQKQVRQALYESLVLACTSNPSLSSSALEMLNQHLSTFLSTDKEVPNPILLAKTTLGQGELTAVSEPLGHLLLCMSRCRVLHEKNSCNNNIDSDENDDAIAISDEITSRLDHLSDGLSHCVVEDISLTGESSVFVVRAEVMTTVLDALIDYNISCGVSTSLQHMKATLSLFRTRKKVETYVTEKLKSSKKGEKSKPKSKTAPTQSVFCLSLAAAVQLLRIALRDSEESSDECVQLARDNVDLQRYLLTVIDQNVSSVKMWMTAKRDEALQYLKAAGRSLLKDCWRTVGVQREDGDYKRERSRSLRCLVTLEGLVSIFVKNFRDKLSPILRELTGKSPSNNKSALLGAISKSGCKMAARVFRAGGDNEDNDGDDDRGGGGQEVVLLLQMVSIFSQEMEEDATVATDVFEFVEQLCRECSVKHAATAEAMLRLLLAQSERVRPGGGSARAVARTIHARLGDVEQDVSVEESTEMACVTEATAAGALSALCGYCDSVFIVVDLAVSKLKGTVADTTQKAIDKSNGDGSCVDHRCELEKMVCVKLAAQIHTLHEVFQSALPAGAAQDHVLRTTTKFYDCISNFIRYYIQLCRGRPEAQLGEKLEKLVQLCANMLKENVFKMINYVHTTPSGHRLVARALKESRLMPALVFAMERYEKDLGSLARRSGIDLMANTRMTTARDFRIIADALRRDDEDADGTQKKPTPKKKPKVG